MEHLSAGCDCQVVGTLSVSGLASWERSRWLDRLVKFQMCMECDT